MPGLGARGLRCQPGSAPSHVSLGAVGSPVWLSGPACVNQRQQTRFPLRFLLVLEVPHFVICPHKKTCINAEESVVTRKWCSQLGLKKPGEGSSRPGELVKAGSGPSRDRGFEQGSEQ